MMKRLIRMGGRNAIEWARTSGVDLRAYADPTNREERSVTVAQAEEIHASDPSLIYLDVSEDDLCPICLVSGIRTAHDGGDPIEWDCGSTAPIVRAWCASCRSEAR